MIEKEYVKETPQCRKCGKYMLPEEDFVCESMVNATDLNILKRLL
jgi:hypothetical protein